MVQPVSSKVAMAIDRWRAERFLDLEPENPCILDQNIQDWNSRCPTSNLAVNYHIMSHNIRPPEANREHEQRGDDF
jgi:hypothetical protein